MTDTTQPAFDPKDFRNTLGLFATGVTIVTTQTEDGENIGMTANSFNSVSLEPPLVLWSLAKKAYSREAFEKAEHWNVHILASSQEDLSNRFARAGEDKFGGLALEDGVSDAPLIPGCTARFQCKTKFQYEGGDHIIFVGEVLEYDRSELSPLLYVSGGYALAAHKAKPISTEVEIPEVELESAQGNSALFSEDFLGYLVGRLHYQLMNSVNAPMQQYGLEQQDFYILSILSVRQPLTAPAIVEHSDFTGKAPDDAYLLSMVKRGLIACEGAQYSLTEKGRDAMLHVVAAAKAVEEDLTDSMGQLQADGLRNLLKLAIKHTDPGLPKLWKKNV